MAKQFLYLQWKSARYALIPFVVAAFSLPLLMVQGLGRITATDPVADAYAALSAYSLLSPLFPLLAFLLGSVLALSAWNWDHQGNHVYALTLPISRVRYSTHRFASGAALAVIPTVALLAGSLIAISLVSLPTGLQAYPIVLTVRFLIATLLAFSLLFALASGTIRTTVIILSAIVAVPIGAELLVDLGAAIDPSWAQVHPTQFVLDALTGPGGPLRIFTGGWVLIDV